VALIQTTQARRGLPLTSAGSELRIALKAWESALKNVPDNYLTRSYEHAAENWDWDKTFTANAVADSFRILVVEDRQRAEADRRNASRRNPDTYGCFHCLDLGYQVVYSNQNKIWYSRLRPCSCTAAPESQRQEYPLTAPPWVRNKLGEYVSREDLDKFGPPNANFKDGVTL